MDKFSFLGNADISWIETQFQEYQKDPQSVESSWARFFEGFEFAKKNFDSEDNQIPENVQKEFKVLHLIHEYRTRGHLFTKTNPVRERRKYSPTLDLENFGLAGDLDTVFQAGEQIGIGSAPLKDIVKHLDDTYCQSIGVEYAYIRDQERQTWIREMIEPKNHTVLSQDDRKQIFEVLSRATLFEQYLQKKFVGQKRFSIEGGEALMPSLNAIVHKGAKLGVKELVIGMAHRGRLNVLTNIFKKKFEDLFGEFEGKEYGDEGMAFDGDVKYHLGYSTIVNTKTGDVKLTLAPNPSHLEAVDPVVEGISRAKIENHPDGEEAILPILIHGDSAIAAQGVVYEVIQMAQVEGYRTGGTIHIVVNNQVGFTTNYLDARSSTYCTDVAKTTLCPVFHVNGDDIDAVVQTAIFALQYRQKFHRDVFIDLLCYRKYGHNEGDEPKFTQPKLYNLIAKHPNPREIYKNQLINDGVIDEAHAKTLETEFSALLDDAYEKSKDVPNAYIDHFMHDTWKDIAYAKSNDFENSPETGFDQKNLRELAIKFNTLPKDNKFFRKVSKLMKDRLSAIEENKLDWALGELLAYATLLEEGFPVRISGQDVERGTFSHRHAVLINEDTEEEYLPLNHLSDNQAKFTIYNSTLSEYGVLGFDYGYSFGVPNGLTIWEAQFGDFNNGAQIIIDQFITAAEDKWRAMNGLVMLLPHGYEGQGSEHSSGRMERFLSMCAENNIQVCNATNPANFFHMLRRQLHRDFRKPLIVFTPKKLLRYPKAVSTIEQLAKGKFIEVIDDPEAEASKIDTIAFCSGKIYYDVLEEKEKQQSGDNIALIRLEQLYPFPEKQVEEIIAKYKGVKNYIWLQEEPENMGAWSFILRHLTSVKLQCIARPASGSPAAGSPRIFEARHRAVMSKLFAYAKQPKEKKVKEQTES